MHERFEKALFAETGLTVSQYYRAFRGICGPPMVRIDTLDIGDLWYYDGLAMTVMACVGQRSLLVAYDPSGPRDSEVAKFRAAHAWLDGEGPDRPRELFLVFAAREEPSGEVCVRHLSLGDWSGLPLVQLPPPKSEYPFRW